MQSDSGLSWDTTQGNLSPGPATCPVVDSEVNPAFREDFGSSPQLFLYPVILTSSPPLLSYEIPSPYQGLQDSVEYAKLAPPIAQGQARAIPQSSFKSCGQCGERFRDILHLKRHVSGKHSDKKHTCGIRACGVFSDLRSLNRHLKTATVHVTEVSPKFQCRCGYSNPRKDHYTRHFKTTQCQGSRTYKCWCGRRDVDRAQHEEHYKPCNRGKRGRPRSKQAEKSKIGKENI